MASPAPALRLPDDVWQCVADMLHSPVPSWVNRRLHTLLQHRHVRWVVPPTDACAALALMAPRMADIRTLCLDCGRGERFRVRGDLVSQLGVLQEAQLLQTLHLSLARKGIGDAGAEMLGQMDRLQNLRDVDLTLDSCDIGDVGAAALARLGGCPSLRNLTLSLADNRLTAHGLQPLSRLACSPPLKRLTLNLRYCPLGAEAVPWLMAILSSPTVVDRLVLDLWGTELGDGGYQLQRNPGNAVVLVDPPWLV
eukprot:EG_transcript_22657